MNLLLPKQHGAWAMLIIPFWLGVASAEFLWQHIPFFVGWLLLYLGTYPLLLILKGKKVSFYTKWTVIYMIPGLLLLTIPLLTKPNIIWFGIAMLPLFLLNIYFSMQNNDRAFMNDLIAIVIFSIVGLASGYLGKEQLDFSDFKLFTTSVLFFIGCTFYVKTMIREKKNIRYKRMSYIYHAIVPFILFVFGEWLAAIAFLPSLFRAVYFYGKTYSIKKIGVLEIINASLFFIIMLIDIAK